MANPRAKNVFTDSRVFVQRFAAGKRVGDWRNILGRIRLRRIQRLRNDAIAFFERSMLASTCRGMELIKTD